MKRPGHLLFLLTCTFSFLFSGAFSQSAPEAPLTLWYDHPAANWNEALPIGNGRLGAMVFGIPEKEKLQLNEETVWAGQPGNNIPDTDFNAALPEIRRLVFAGQYDSAHRLAMNKIPRHAGANNNYGMPYQPVGNLSITFPGHESASLYKRELDITNAIHTVKYSVGGTTFTRETFASFHDHVIIMKVSADKAKSISCTIDFDSPHASAVISTEKKLLLLQGRSSDKDNKKGMVEFVAAVKANADGGKIESTGKALKVSGANSVTFYISIGTNFRSYNDLSGNAYEKATSLLSSVGRSAYGSAKLMHTRYYQEFFNRVTLNLGKSTSENKPTDIRLAEFKNAFDPQFASLYFQFGRYLLICSSQPGTQPANLQGIWNDHLNPPWDSKYTININTEMNYWPAEVTGLSEMHAPLFSMLKDLEATGKESATKMYGARGWVVHHNTDLWRITGPVDGAFYGLWPMGGAWLSQHLWQHYLYTGNTKSLREYYSILRGAALFYHDVLQRDPATGWLMVSPSMSPENSHHNGISISAGTTMDNQLVFDVFTNFIRASEILKEDHALRDSVEAKLNQLPPMQIGKHSQVQEWLYDWDRPDDKHRHISHLYGLFPSNQISPYRQPALFKAARNTLEFRGDESTGWSMGWKVNWWARLQDGDRALKLIKDQLTPAAAKGNGAGGTYSNLLDAHPPFQIDGNFGCTAGIAEMLIQSHDGAIHLLPAVPSEWTSGKVTGLHTRGGFIVDLQWENGSVTALTIVSTLGGTCRLRSYQPLAHERLKGATGENSNPFFAEPPVKKEKISPSASALDGQIRTVKEYDFDTTAGRTYQFTFSH